jgi:iron complex transport system ATP-binding protein
MTAIAAEGLSVVRGEATLINGLSLSLGPTGSVAIIGPNGAGKSTLVKVLAGIELPTKGRVQVAGCDLKTLSICARAEVIGYVPQHFEPHWDLSAAELVQLGAGRAQVPQKDAVASIFAEYELSKLQHRRWSTLSGGERARVLLAMVLVVDPPALLADEPGASLDIRHRIDVVKALVRRSKDRLSVVVMHDLDLAFRYFDRVIVIDRGSIVADAAPSDLIYDKRLDTTFGVSFERLATPYGPLLRAT